MTISEILSVTIASISLFVSLIFSIISLDTNKKNSKMRKDWENYQKQMNENKEKTQTERNEILTIGINDIVKTLKESWESNSIVLTTLFSNVDQKILQTQNEKSDPSSINSSQKNGRRKKESVRIKCNSLKEE